MTDEKMQIRLRKACADDWPDVQPLMAEIDQQHAEGDPLTFRVPADASEHAAWWRQWLADGKLFLVASVPDAEHGGEAIAGLITGQLAVHDSAPILVPSTSCMINTICVSQRFQRRGIGRALMHAAEGWAVEHGARDLELVVMHFNTQAQAFYESLGYRPKSIRQRKLLFT